MAVKSIVRGNYGILLMTVMMMVLVYLNLIFTPSLLEGVIANTNAKLVDTLTGNVAVEPGRDKSTIDNVNALTEDIRKIKGVEAVCARSRIGGEIRSGDENGNWDVYGIDPAADKKVFKTSRHLIEGKYLGPEDTGQILLGAQIAGAGKKGIELYGDSLKNVHAGDKVQVRFTNGVKKEFTVKGIFYVQFIQADLRAYITEKDLQALTGSKPDTASSVYIRTRAGVKESKVIRDIRRTRDDVRFKTWEDRAGIIKNMTDSFVIINDILRIVALFVAAITIFIVTYVDLANKRRQIGIQRAIGIGSQAIVASYLIRAAFYAVIGACLAVLVFLYVIVPLEAKYPFHFPQGDVLLAINGKFMARNGVILFLVALVSALVPAERSISMAILDAIWG